MDEKMDMEGVDHPVRILLHTAIKTASVIHIEFLKKKRPAQARYTNRDDAGQSVCVLRLVTPQVRRR